jgi:hypothetical protein
MSQVNKSTINTFTIPPIDSNRAVTINFIDLLCDINRKGRKVLNKRNIFTALKSIVSTLASIRLVITIKKSN